jgi:hypothetical protein
VPLGSTSDSLNSCNFEPHNDNVQLMPPANRVHSMADGDSWSGSHISGKVQLTSPPSYYHIYPEIFYSEYFIVSGHSTTVV